MNMYESLGPFASYLRDLPRNGEGWVIDTLEFSDIIRTKDYVKNSTYYEKLLKVLKKEITRDPALILTCLSSSVTNMVLGKSGFKEISFDFCDNYIVFLQKSSIKDFDIDLCFGFLRIFMEIGFPIKKTVATAISWVVFFDNDAEREDVKSVMRNNEDVLDRLSEMAEADVYAECLITAIDELCNNDWS